MTSTGQSTAKSSRVALDPLQKSLQEFVNNHSFLQHYIVAYSGGRDSHSLLHALVSLRSQTAEAGRKTPSNITAVYIDHGLQAESTQWRRHCQIVCEQLGVEFRSIKVDARAKPGESPEASARKARYQALGECIGGSLDCLITAQHADDQAETLLLQLLRGSGPRGLAAMPPLAPFAGGWHARPWLSERGESIQRYAVDHQLPWIEDPSNQQDDYDRNYLRNQVMPLLKQRWPGLSETLGRSARWQAESAALLEELARMDHQHCQTESEPTLQISELRGLSRERQANLIRYWLVEQGHDPATAVLIQQIRRQLLGVESEADALVRWSTTEVRRYRGQLYAEAMQTEFDASGQVQWRPEIQPVLQLPGDNGQLMLRLAQHGLSFEQLAGRSICVSYRTGGEWLRLRGKRRSLKSLYQEAGVPPWQRERIPLLSVDDEFIAVVGLWLADDWRQAGSDVGFVGWPEWERLVVKRF